MPVVLGNLLRYDLFWRRIVWLVIFVLNPHPAHPLGSDHRTERHGRQQSRVLTPCAAGDAGATDIRNTP